MSAASGLYANVKIGNTAVVEATRWEMDESAKDHTYSSNATGGLTFHVTGPVDRTGTIEGIFDPDDPVHSQMEPGDDVTLKLFTKAGKGHSVPAKILTLNHGGNIEEGDPLRWRATWGQAGSPTMNDTLS